MSHPQVGQDLYVVERIVAKKTMAGKLYYLVKWLGYPQEQNTWEKVSHLRYVTELIDEYEAQEGLKNTVDHGLLSSNGPTQLVEISSQDLSHISQTQNQGSSEPIKVGISLAQLEKIAEKDQDLSSQTGEDRPKLGRKEEQPRDGEKKKKRVSFVPSGQGMGRLGKRGKEGKKQAKKNKTERKQREGKAINLPLAPPCPTEQPTSSFQKEAPPSSDSQQSSQRAGINWKGQKSLKAEESEEGQRGQSSQLRIRLVEDEEESDLHEYVVIYPRGNTKLYNSCELFYAHPVEFVEYLERKAHKKRH